MLKNSDRKQVIRMKYKRHSRILEIIREYDIDTQDALIEKLHESGFDVTQATASRDIRELKLIKVMTPDNQLKYTLSPKEDGKSVVKYNNILHDTISSMDCAQNLVVLKTYPGMASAAAAAIDAIHYDDIVGCIAGDDTILLVFKTNPEAQSFLDKFKKSIA